MSVQGSQRPVTHFEYSDVDHTVTGCLMPEGLDLSGRPFSSVEFQRRQLGRLALPDNTRLTMVLGEVSIAERAGVQEPDLTPKTLRLCDEEVVLSMDDLTVTTAGDIVQLTYSEGSLLEALARNQGALLTRPWILENVLVHEGRFVSSRTIDVQIKRLREKLGPYRDWIATVRRGGEQGGYLYRRPIKPNDTAG